MMTNTSTRETRKVYHTPLTDIYSTSDSYTVKMEMPGITRDNLSIIIEDDELKINGESKSENSKEDLKYAEYTDRNYSRTFRVGNDIDRNKIDAKLENGILTLTLHKSEEAKPKKISINQIN